MSRPSYLCRLSQHYPISRFCASHLPGWENQGELVFVTSRECRDITPEEASEYILGYTIGNDLSCRFFQLPEQSGGRFFYAMDLDKFAPIGSVLVSPTIFAKETASTSLVTRINGEVKQNTVIEKDMIFFPDEILSWMSQNAFRQYSSQSFKFVKGKVTSLSVEEKTVLVDGQGLFSFDYLVIASGSTTESSITSGSTPIPFKASNSDDMRSRIKAAQELISTSSSIVIGGGGPIAVELAGELAEAAMEVEKPVSITIVSATERVLPMLKISGSEAAMKLLKNKNVVVRSSRKVIKTTPPVKGLGSWEIFLDNEEKLEADLYISATGAIPNNNFVPQEFLDEKGWVKVDQELRIRGKEGQAPLPIFAAGDITNNSMRLSFKAQEQAAVVAANIIADISGRTTRRSYDQGQCILMMVPVGSTGGTGQVFGLTPWSVMVRLIKGRDYFISKAASAVTA
ncbi:Apoptosis-inducing factor 2 [Penicillium subrubescens]|uniref:Apoptosis-inducing factor 2 n=1 Tax=Penicillium subrubescens TaxID=1316194 RepID=A0A1Q5UFA7_9EURO|nr:Apoptosis-inducing factor 2 [Penicillium subrubescens]